MATGESGSSRRRPDRAGTLARARASFGQRTVEGLPKIIFFLPLLTFPGNPSDFSGNLFPAAAGDGSREKGRRERGRKESSFYRSTGGEKNRTECLQSLTRPPLLTSTSRRPEERCVTVLEGARAGGNRASEGAESACVLEGPLEEQLCPRSGGWASRLALPKLSPARRRRSTRRVLPAQFSSRSLADRSPSFSFCFSPGWCCLLSRSKDWSPRSFPKEDRRPDRRRDQEGLVGTQGDRAARRAEPSGDRFCHPKRRFLGHQSSQGALEGQKEGEGHQARRQPRPRRRLRDR